MKLSERLRLQLANLNLADYKTESVLIIWNRSKEILKLRKGKLEKFSSDAIKYLRVFINFKKHAVYICQKSNEPSKHFG